MPSVFELANISNGIYSPDIITIGSWSRAGDPRGSDSSGFYASFFLHNNGRDMVVAFRGTDYIADGIEDLGIFLGRYPSQAVQASTALTEWMSQYGANRRVLLTGHSLGGGLASLMANAYDLPCVTFNAPGMSRSSIPSWVPSGISDVLAIGQSLFASETDILHIRAYFDAVSVGTGPRMGIVHNISVACAPPPVSAGSVIFSALAPAASTVLSAGRYVACQHSMNNVVAALKNGRLYNREIDFSQF